MSDGTNLKIKLAITTILLAIGCKTVGGRIIYVDTDANGANNGSSWTNAYNYLQDALADASSAKRPIEIWVAEGIYTPDKNSAVPDGTGDRRATFELINDVIIKGGFAGGQLDVRDIGAYETILSGDLNGDDVGVANLEDLRYETTRAENSYHVVTSNLTDETAVLEGFVITGGNARSTGGGMYSYYGTSILIDCTFSGNSADNSGGGMYNYGGAPILIRCTFSGNSARIEGGGMYNYGRVPILIPILTNCTFSRNSAKVGGGISNVSCSSTLTNCTFSGNSAINGGGMSNLGSYRTLTTTLTNCTFSGNSAEGWGGGMYNKGIRPILANCTFSGNSSKGEGGGIGNIGSHSILTNCTFAQNSAENGNALAFNSSGRGSFSSYVELINCILWDGGNEIWNDDGSTVDVTYSNIQSGQNGVFDPYERIIWGEGNIDADPLFAVLGHYDENGTPDDANDDYWVDGDYHLKSEAGRWDRGEGRWTKDDVTSPCIDAGNPMSTIGNEPFPNGGIINMGAYGGTDEASKSYFGEPVCETIVAGDINGDCKVDLSDFAIMALHWLE
ncbi:MAG: hypothetical protein ACYS80_14840 [Planctomycetota bacterium]|jgi:hypothetical protein